ECLLAPQREHELLAGDAEVARHMVDGLQRDALDRLAETFGLGALAHLTRVCHRRRLERSSAEGDVRDHDGCDERERDEEGREPPHTTRLRTNARGTSAHSVRAAARKNGPEKALVTARSSWSWSAETSELHSSSSGRSSSARSTSGSSPASRERSTSASTSCATPSLSSGGISLSSTTAAPARIASSRSSAS